MQSGAASYWSLSPNPKEVATRIAKHLNCSSISSSTEIRKCLESKSVQELLNTQISFQPVCEANTLIVFFTENPCAIQKKLLKILISLRNGHQWTHSQDSYQQQKNPVKVLSLVRLLFILWPFPGTKRSGILVMFRYWQAVYKAKAAPYLQLVRKPTKQVYKFPSFSTWSNLIANFLEQLF